MAATVRALGALGLLALLVAAPASAHPSFDCAKASTAIERSICKDPELATADRALAGAYQTLAAKLGGRAREELTNDQLRWLGDRRRGCSGENQELAVCLKRSYATRTATLKALAEGDYPFISTHTLFRNGKLGKITWAYGIHYPQFDGTTADFMALNAALAASAAKTAADATPTAEAGADREQGWSYEEDFTISRPNGRSVLVIRAFWGSTGGAHGYGATRCLLVDLRTGKPAGPQAVFASGNGWLDVLLPAVRDGLEKQFVERPGFDEALEPAALRKTLRDGAHYCWQRDTLHLVFNQYDVGSYASGPYEVDIPMATLRPLLRVDGPLAD